MIFYFEIVRGFYVRRWASPFRVTAARPIMPASQTRKSHARFNRFSPILKQATAHHDDIDALNWTQQTAGEGNTIRAVRTNLMSRT